MAYADYKFYTESYFGNVVPKSDFPRMESKASDFVDILTHDRLVNGLPTDERAQTRIKRRSAHWRIHCTRLSLLKSRLFP